jgi:hypothetical protein
MKSKKKRFLLIEPLFVLGAPSAVKSDYTVNGDPQTQNQTGVRRINTDQSSVIHASPSATAGVGDSPLS